MRPINRSTTPLIAMPRHANELWINDKDLPLDCEVDGTQVAIVPPLRGGVVASGDPAVTDVGVIPCAP